MPRSKSLAVVRYLAEQQRREPELCYVEDWRIAEFTVLYAHRGLSQPFEAAFLQLKGKCHADALAYWARAEEILDTERAQALWNSARKAPQPELVADQKKRIA